jgi:ABC-2 type transport system ATP-binding protein
MTQRLCLAKTLIHDPQVLLLDEPASGLDPRARIEMRELLKELGQMGKTIVVSSHILPELADVCNKIGIIEQGRLVASGTFDELVSKFRGPVRIRMRVSEGVEAAREAVVRLAGVSEVTLEDGMLLARLARPDVDLTLLIRAALDAGVKLVAFERDEHSLEDVFLTATNGVVS